LIMLVLPGQNPAGNILHVIIGPETELFSDIHGAALLDITDVLAHMEQGRETYLSVTRTKSEAVTAQQMRSSGIVHKNSFGKQEKPADNPNTSSVTNVGKCEFCNRDAELMSIPKIKICHPCAQIELGRIRLARENPDAL